MNTYLRHLACCDTWEEVENQPEPEKRTGLEFVTFGICVLLIIGLLVVWANV